METPETRQGKREQKLKLRKAIAKKLKLSSKKLKGLTTKQLYETYLTKMKNPDPRVVKLIEQGLGELKREKQPELEDVVVIKSQREAIFLPKGTKYKLPDSDKIYTQKYNEAQRKRIIDRREEQRKRLTDRKEVKDVMEEMLDLIEASETKPEKVEEESKISEKEKKEKKLELEDIFKPMVEGLTGPPERVTEEEIMKRFPEEKVDVEEDEPTTDEEYDFNIGRQEELDRTQLMPAKEFKSESDRMDVNDRFSDNFYRGVNSYGAFMSNPIVPERRRYRDFSIGADIREQNLTMRNDPDPLVEPPQNILEQNRILEGPDDRMPEAEVEPINMERVEYEESVAANNMHSIEQNIQDRHNRNVRIAQRRILGGEDVEDDPFGEGVEVEQKYQMEEKDDPNLLVRDDEDREQSFLNYQRRLESQLSELSMSGHSKRNETRGKQAHYEREGMRKLKAHEKMSQMNLDALRKKDIKWQRPTRTQAGNNVGLIRQSNRSMALRTHLLLP